MGSFLKKRYAGFCLAIGADFSYVSMDALVQILELRHGIPAGQVLAYRQVSRVLVACCRLKYRQRVLRSRLACSLFKAATKSFAISSLGRVYHSGHKALSMTFKSSSFAVPSGTKPSATLLPSSTSAHCPWPSVLRIPQRGFSVRLSMWCALASFSSGIG